VETAQTSAGDDKRNDRPEGARFAAGNDRSKLGERRSGKLCETRERREATDNKPDIEQVTVQIVARLKKNVHRNRRGDDDVEEHDQEPRFASQVDRHLLGKIDRRNKKDQPDNRCEGEVHLNTIDEDSKNQRCD
jgi:hypothetical protein